jgi:2-polyprenyl-6-methoxyphenol hydroxylase-like FAD-dependent oxidoreductase
MKQFSAEPGRAVTHSRYVGKQAVIIGAGIAGLAAAGALADWFEEVTVLERDHLPDGVACRPGTPQAWHSHGLLLGGLFALEELFPALGDDLTAAGAVPLRFNQDFREELPNREAMPQRDFGWVGYTMTRPLVESTLRRRVVQRRNVTLRQSTRAFGIIAEGDQSRVTGVRCSSADDGGDETLSAELVVDASGRGHLTAALLQSIGRPPAAESVVGIDLGYTTTVLDIPDDAPSDWKAVLTHSNAPQSSRRAVMLPVEHGRWMMTLAGRGSDRPPGEWDALLGYLRELNTPTIYNAVRKSVPVGRLARFGFPESIWRHYERLADFPAGLIPIGDAICRFNPIYGQGMTVAAKEASLLHRLIASRAAEPDPLAGLGQRFFADAKPLVETAWTMAAIPDFAYPNTRGIRPNDLDHSLHFAQALSRIAARDEAVQRLVVEVWHLLKPRSVYQQLVPRVEAEMEMAVVAAS